MKPGDKVTNTYGTEGTILHVIGDKAWVEWDDFRGNSNVWRISRLTPVPTTRSYDLTADEARALQIAASGVIDYWKNDALRSACVKLLRHGSCS